MKVLQAIFVMLYLLHWGSAVHAHEARPFFVEVNEQAAGTYRVGWQVPPSLQANNRPHVRLPGDCNRIGLTQSSGVFSSERLYRCATVLDGRAISISYPLYNPSVSTLIRITFVTGEQHTVLAGPEATAAVVPERESKAGVAFQYLRLGVEHILAGFDHLLFLTCLLFIARTMKRVIVVITGFTLAHSLTLGLSALQVLRVATPPVEAAIALSILFLAVEIARAGQRNVRPLSLTWRYPIAVSCSFGLLHGFGFAAVLQDTGLPQTQVTTALLFFNLGVELGQLLFIVGVYSLVKLSGLVSGKLFADYSLPVDSFTRVAAYCVGILSSYWLVERIAAFPI